MSNFAMMMATVVIAYATWQTWHVYQRMSEQIEKQISLTRDSSNLTRPFSPCRSSDAGTRMALQRAGSRELLSSETTEWCGK
jgi:hypothetical protein